MNALVSLIESDFYRALSMAPVVDASVCVFAWGRLHCWIFCIRCDSLLFEKLLVVMLICLYCDLLGC